METWKERRGTASDIIAGGARDLGAVFPPPHQRRPLPLSVWELQMYRISPLPFAVRAESQHSLPSVREGGEADLGSAF